jgi:mono/diheme cytochrome c family protein
VARTQLWHYPSRTECRSCHSYAAGFALGFATAQLNRDVDYGKGPTNQISALAAAGYITSPLTNLNLWPMLVAATNEAWSREWRVRSYLAANCAQCHQPGGNGLGHWDARAHNPLSAAGLIGGTLINDEGNSDARVIVPGSLSQSMLLSRLSRRGPGQMPPLATSLLDTQAVALVSAWITNDLARYETFPEWQTNRFGGSDILGAAAGDDPDADGSQNFLEWLTGTDPGLPTDFWAMGVERDGDILRVVVPQMANRGFELQTADSLAPGATWMPLDLPVNRRFISATNQLLVFEQPVTNATSQFFRVRVYEP